MGKDLTKEKQMSSPTIMIVGFGSQARAWALNLRDSKISFVIGLNPGSHSKKKAQDLGFSVVELQTNILSNYENFLMLIPDDQHNFFFEANISFLKAGSRFVYAHGFSLSKERLHEKYSKFSHVLLAPKAIASEVRFQYETKGKIGAVYFTGIKEDYDFITSISKNLGFTALYEAHFEEECIADLFSEQAILCSLLPYGALKTYNILIGHGIPRELAFMECFLELKSISQALVTLGPEEFFKLISPNALIGSEKGQEILLDAHFDEALNKLFTDIKNKKFYKETEVNHGELRSKILNRWKHEHMSETFNKLKSELI
jgi:ketol-acid reductoisomerase